MRAPRRHSCARWVEDAGGQLARALAAAQNIALHDARSAMSTGTAGIFVDAQGRNSIVIGAGANATLSREFVADQREAIRAAGVVLMQLETPIATMHALQLAREARCLTLLNPAPANVDTTEALLALTDILTPNESEFAVLLPRHCGTSIEAEQIAAMDDTRLHALCRQLLPHGTVIVTLGAGGVFVSHADPQRHGDAAGWYRIAAEIVDVVDTTGAGDAFNGALAASLATGARPFSDCVDFANRYAAMSTEREGAALSMPLLAEVDERYGFL